MSDGFLSLIERLDNFKEDDVELDEDIATAIGYKRLEDYGKSTGDWVSPKDWEAKRCWEEWGSNINPPSFSTSVNAALSIYHTKQPSDILHSAISNLSKRFSLHTCFWPEENDYGEWLARYIAMESLRRLVDEGKANVHSDSVLP